MKYSRVEKWYKNNFSLRECIYELHKNISINQRIINLYSELIKINNTLKPEDVEKNKEDKKQTEQELKLEEEFVKLLYSFDENEKIQNILK